MEGKSGHKVSSTSQISGRRSSEIMELVAAAKRRALESRTGSPKASSPRRIVPLSRESSFKSLDNGKEKPGQTSRRMGVFYICCAPLQLSIFVFFPIKQFFHSLENISCPDVLSSIYLNRDFLILWKGTLLKSCSFNNFKSKSRVKLDDDVPQKQKGGGEHVSKNTETPIRTIGKSMSFKSSNLGRATESKVKMLSPKSGIAQNLKGSSLAKQSGVFDRKSLSRIDQPVVCSTMASSVISTHNQNLTPRGETVKPLAINCNRDFKVNHDGKSSSLSKSVNNISNESSEPLVISGVNSIGSV